MGFCLKNIKLVFEVTINIQSGAKWPLTANPHFLCNKYKPVLLTKENFFWCFDTDLEHMPAQSRGNKSNFDWLRRSCDISTCDLSPMEIHKRMEGQ